MWSDQQHLCVVDQEHLCVVWPATSLCGRSATSLCGRSGVSVWDRPRMLLCGIGQELSGVAGQVFLYLTLCDIEFSFKTFSMRLPVSMI